MIRTARPKEIFRGAEGSIELAMPREGDVITILERCLLTAAARSIGARRIFEFGTHLGRTTRHFAINHPAAEIFTLDLPEIFTLEPMDFAGDPCEKRITRIYADSTRWRVPPDLLTSIDFIFIDGGHYTAAITEDTINACQMIRPGGIIAWHDFGAPQYPEVTEYLNQIGKEAFKLVRIEETSLVFFDSCGNIGAPNGR